MAKSTSHYFKILHNYTVRGGTEYRRGFLKTDSKNESDELDKHKGSVRVTAGEYKAGVALENAALTGTLPSADDDEAVDVQSLGKNELLEMAQGMNIEGFGKMNKAELVAAIEEAKE